MSRHRCLPFAAWLSRLGGVMAALHAMWGPGTLAAQVQLYPDTLHVRAEQQATPEVFEVQWHDSALSRLRAVAIRFPRGLYVQGYGAASDRAGAPPCGIKNDRQRLDVVGQRMTYDLSDVTDPNPSPCALGGVIAYLRQDAPSFLELRVTAGRQSGDTVVLASGDSAAPGAGLRVLRATPTGFQRALLAAALGAGALLLLFMFARSTRMARRQEPRAP